MRVDGLRGTTHRGRSRHRGVHLSAAHHDEKRRLRAEAKRRRAAVADPVACRQLCACLGDAIAGRRIALAPGAAVSAYWPKGDEVDLRPAMTALARQGHPIGLPVVMNPEAPLLFRLWAPGDRLVEAGFGLMEPSAERAEVTPEILLMPLLAFDRRGMRLGYGGGFYDRTLAGLDDRGLAPLAVGIAYAGQELPEVPFDSTDRPLDWVVTENEVIDTREFAGATAVLR